MCEPTLAPTRMGEDEAKTVLSASLITLTLASTLLLCGWQWLWAPYGISKAKKGTCFSLSMSRTFVRCHASDV